MILTIDRQHRRNALDPEAHHQLASLFDRFADSDAHLVAIITGAGDRAFCSGSDLSVEASLDRANLPPTGFAGLTERFDLIKPVIAAVNGDAIGGGMEIVLACDLCVAVPTARFSLPEPRVGLAASGGLHRLARQMPLKQAMELALTGRMFAADELVGMGVVNQLSPSLTNGADVLATALETATLICENAPLAVRATKQMMMRGLDLPDLKAAYAARYSAFETMLASEDAREGRKAFLQKRNPEWRGR
ncbi:MAG: enoyl-CoA hydratase-related protein [Candidatus Puniceispirillaceae bacterium]